MNVFPRQAFEDVLLRGDWDRCLAGASWLSGSSTASLPRMSANRLRVLHQNPHGLRGVHPVGPTDLDHGHERGPPKAVPQGVSSCSLFFRGRMAAFKNRTVSLLSNGTLGGKGTWFASPIGPKGAPPLPPRPRFARSSGCPAAPATAPRASPGPRSCNSLSVVLGSEAAR